jgi:hypothetical protein
MRSDPNQETTMSDEPTQPSPTSAEPPAAEAPSADPPARSDRRGVQVPAWLAAAFVVLLGLAIGAAGFAIGRVTDSGPGRPHPVFIGRGPIGGGGGFGSRGAGGRFGGFGGFGQSGGSGTPTTPTTPTAPTAPTPPGTAA